MTENSDPRVTEYRLRSWLNSNQAKQEQMCLALLPSLGLFTDCKPRRPKGGPDRGRDIEAVFDNSINVWGAVGFRNDASSSNEDRRLTIKKDNEDLSSALNENPNLEGFAFFTNVDLTTTQKDELIKYAIAQKLKKTWVFDFEDLRYNLDRPEGLIVRFQYLDLPMTPTEQAALVNKYGNQIQETIVQEFGFVKHTLERIEFLVGCQLPAKEINIDLSLSKGVTASDIINEACVLRLDSTIQEYNPITGEKYIPSTAFLVQTDPNYPSNNLSTVSYLWLDSKPNQLINCGRVVYGSIAHNFEGHCGFSIRKGVNIITLGELLSDRMGLYCTSELRKYIIYIKVLINGFIRFNMLPPNEEIYQPPYNIDWVENTPSELSDRKWFSLTRVISHLDIFKNMLSRN